MDDPVSGQGGSERGGFFMFTTGSAQTWAGCLCLQMKKGPSDESNGPRGGRKKTTPCKICAVGSGPWGFSICVLTGRTGFLNISDMRGGRPLFERFCPLLVFVRQCQQPGNRRNGLGGESSAFCCLETVFGGVQQITRSADEQLWLYLGSRRSCT
jgi:hypothetical protein